MSMLFDTTVRVVTRYFPTALFTGSAFVALIQASGFPSAAGGIPGPALAPLLFAVSLGIIGMVLAVQTWREGVSVVSTNAKVSEASETRVTYSHWAALPVLILMLCAYALIMPLMGFISTNTLFLYGSLRVFGHAGGIRAWAFAIAVSYILLFIFDYLMQVPLPKGWLG